MNNVDRIIFLMEEILILSMFLGIDCLEDSKVSTSILVISKIEGFLIKSELYCFNS